MQLTDPKTYAWQTRLDQETDQKNLTHGHKHIATVLLGWLLAGHDTVSHGALAALAKSSITCVQDTLKRLRQLGLLGQEHQFELRDGRRRQIANRYWTRLPDDVVVPRPDIRRHRGGGLHRPSKEVSKFAYGQQCWGIPEPTIDLLLRRREQVEGGKVDLKVMFPRFPQANHAKTG